MGLKENILYVEKDNNLGHNHALFDGVITYFLEEFRNSANTAIRAL